MPMFLNIAPPDILLHVTYVVFDFFFNDTATTEIYTTTDTLSLHDALPIFHAQSASPWVDSERRSCSTSRLGASDSAPRPRSEEHTSELQSPVVISYAV